MTVLIREKTANSQIGFCASYGAAYQQAPSSINFANGQYILIRMPMPIPKGATINSASLRFNHNAKKDQAQVCYNFVQAHAAGDSPILVRGANESIRPWTKAKVNQTLSWVVGTPVNEMVSTVDVKLIIDELLSLPDYTTQGSVTFLYYTENENGSDMSILANNVLLPTVRLTVDYTPPTSGVQTQVNMLNNPDLGTAVLAANDEGDTNTAPYWRQDTFYGVYVEAANYGTIARDTSFTRVAGIPTLRFTCGTPPAETQKRTGPLSTVKHDGGSPVIFSGWVYIPTTIPVTTNRFYVGDPFVGGGKYIDARGKWVPFSTDPVTRGTIGTFETFWPTLGVKEFQAGWQFWVSEPTVIHSNCPQIPFNGLTPDIFDTNGSLYIDHQSSVSGQNSARIWTPRTSVIRNGQVQRVPSFRKTPEGLMQIVDQTKGGSTTGNLSPIAVSSYPATKIIYDL